MTNTRTCFILLLKEIYIYKERADNNKKTRYLEAKISIQRHKHTISFIKVQGSTTTTTKAKKEEQYFKHIIKKLIDSIDFDQVDLE